MRSDARCNRLRILEAAAAVLAAPGDTSMKAIARRAGVGQGTLYRHFPTRESLILQVYGEEVEELVRTVPALVAALGPPRALHAWLERFLSLGEHAPEFAAVMSEVTGVLTGECSQVYHQLLGAVAELVEANDKAGTVTAGTTADDVLLLLGPLWRVGSAERERARSKRLLDTILRGLCPAEAAADATPVTGALLLDLPGDQ